MGPVTPKGFGDHYGGRASLCLADGTARHVGYQPTYQRLYLACLRCVLACAQRGIGRLVTQAAFFDSSASWMLSELTPNTRARALS